MKNTNNINEWRKQAIELNEEITKLLEQAFGENNSITYCVGLGAWKDRVRVDTFITLQAGICSIELKEIFGNESEELNFDERTSCSDIASYRAKVMCDIARVQRKAEAVRKFLNN